MPSGPAILALVPRLVTALDGGPAVLPVPAGGTSAADPLSGGVLHPDDDDPDDPTAVVMPTSGSTGEPKQVLLPASALRASAAATERRLGGPGGWLLALPAWHIAGLQVLLRAAATGSAATEVAVLDATESFSPSGFAAAAAELDSPRRYVSLVPTQLHRILADSAATEVLAAFDAVLVGGAAASPSLLEAAGRAGVRVVTTYGMSETCGGCVYDGVPLDGARVRVDTVDGPVGPITLSGPIVARGYRGDAGHPNFPARGTFVTGDIGTWDGDRLSVHGRADDVIVTGGLKVPPGPVERALALLPDVGEVLVAGVPDAEWGQRVTALVTGRVPESAEVDRVLGDLPRHHRPRRWLRVAQLPLLGPGKPDRRTAARLADGAG